MTKKELITAIKLANVTVNKKLEKATIEELQEVYDYIKVEVRQGGTTAVPSPMQGDTKVPKLLTGKV